MHDRSRVMDNVNSLGQSRTYDYARLSLPRGALWTGIGNLIFATCQWGTIIAIARLGSTSMVGYYALGVSLTAPVIIATNMALRTVQVTDATGDYEFREYLALRILTSLLAAVFVAGAVLLANFPPTTSSVVTAVLIAKMSESLSDIIYGLYQSHNLLDRLAQSLIIRGLSSLASMSIGLYLFNSLIAGSYILAATWVALLLFIDLPIALRLLDKEMHLPTRNCISQIRNLLRDVHHEYTQQWSRMASLARLASPMGLASLLIALNWNIPRYFIQFELGTYELGVFAALTYVTIAGNTIVSALAQAALPRLTQHHSAQRRIEFRRLLGALVGTGILLCCGSIAFALVAGERAISLIYGADNAQHADLFTWLMLASGLGFISSFLDYGVSAARRFQSHARMQVVSTLGIVLVSLPALQQFGLVGVAWLASIVFGVQILWKLLILRGVITDLDAAPDHKWRANESTSR